MNKKNELKRVLSITIETLRIESMYGIERKRERWLMGGWTTQYSLEKEEAIMKWVRDVLIFGNSFLGLVGLFCD